MKESLGLIGRKCGMTRLFKEDGTGVPVSVIEMTPNRITQLKSANGKHGYNAIQVTYGTVKPQRLNKPTAGFFTKINVEAGRGLREFRVSANTLNQYTVGQTLGVDLFSEGQRVDVIGITKGKGFAGVLKRHHFAAQDASHGNSLSHRAPGSIGQRQSPGRVFKGKRMSGHMGNEKSTIHNLEVVKVIAAKNLLLVKGAIPGAAGGDVIVRPTVKN